MRDPVCQLCGLKLAAPCVVVTFGDVTFSTCSFNCARWVCASLAACSSETKWSAGARRPPP